METKEKLRLILKWGGLTQSELAGRLGVTFAALNRWVNEKAVPRLRAQTRIDELYREVTGQKVIPPNVLEAKKALVFQKRKARRNILTAYPETLRRQLF